jgi:ATP-binding cassette, subfamily C (CFTR/MRP), member 1
VFLVVASGINTDELEAIWMKWWSEASEARPNDRVGMYVGVYAMFGVAGSLFACVTAW